MLTSSRKEVAILAMKVIMGKVGFCAFFRLI